MHRKFVWKSTLFWHKPQKSAIFSPSLQNISIQLLSNFTDTLVLKIPCGFVKNQFAQTDKTG